MTTTTTSRRTAHLVIGVLATLASFPLAQSRNQTLTAPIGLELDASLEGFVFGEGVNIGTPIGFAVIDSDGDGRDEIISGSVPLTAWERVVHDPDLPGYRIDRVAPHPYPIGNNETGQHAGEVWLVADVGVPARPKIFTQIAPSTIAVYDARTGQLERDLLGPHGGVRLRPGGQPHPGDLPRR